MTDECLVCMHVRGLHSPRGDCIASGCNCEGFVEGPPVDLARTAPAGDAIVVAAVAGIGHDGCVSVTLLGRHGEELGRLWLDHATARTLATALLQVTAGDDN